MMAARPAAVSAATLTPSEEGGCRSVHKAAPHSTKEIAVSIPNPRPPTRTPTPASTVSAAAPTCHA